MDNGEAELIRPEDVQVLTTMDRVVSGSRRAIAEARAAGNEMTTTTMQPRQNSTSTVDSQPIAKRTRRKPKVE